MACVETGRGSRTPGQRAGDAAEALVARRLTEAGWTIVGRNLRVGRGELDILAIDPGPPAALAVIEVRWRSSRAFGLVEETVDWRKRRHIRTAAMRLLEDGLPDGRSLPPLPLRFDLVVVEPAAVPGGEPRLRHHRHVVGSG